MSGSFEIGDTTDSTTNNQLVEVADGGGSGNKLGITASNEAKVLVTPLTNSSIVKAQVQDNSGNGITSDNPGTANNQRLHVTTPDTTTATSTFNALNTNVVIATSGLTSVGFQINAGTLAATFTPYVSIDGGTTYTAANFYDSFGGDILSSVTVTNPNVYKIYTVITLGGTSHVKVQVTSYTSGSATALLRASLTSTISITPSGAGGGAAAFNTVATTTPTVPGNTATLIIAANPARKYLMISNPSGSLAYIAFGSTTGLTTSSGIPIVAKSFYELKGDNLYTGAIYAISASSITWFLTEGTP